MNPRAAADIISNLNKDFALEILRGLEDKDAAAILENMDVQKAAELSQEIQN
ncbi:MAG: hypothetical protein K9K32_00305 [Halanaerobiales bacterium]|nr:hypothetical protein [Halanaerobiales bacterium]